MHDVGVGGGVGGGGGDGSGVVVYHIYMNIGTHQN